MGRKALWARAGYGAVFCVALPVLLWAWAWGAEGVLGAPGVRWVWGWIGAAVGGVLMGWGMWALWSRGGGLPMNAFPPERLVRGGVYAVVPHPIYVGFVLVCLGVAVGTGSGSGLWLVTPAVAGGCAALVWGYEREDLRRRFGDVARPWLAVGGGGGWVVMSGVTVLGAVVWWQAGWMSGPGVMATMAAIGVALAGAAVANVRGGPVSRSATTAVSGDAIPVAGGGGGGAGEAASGAMSDARVDARVEARIEVVRAWSSAVALGAVVVLGGGRAAAWAWAVAVGMVGARAVGGRWGKTGAVGGMAAVVGVATLAGDGVGAVVGAGVFVVAWHRRAVYSVVLAWAQQTANSWHEWRAGRVRVISHVTWSGLAGAVGFAGVAAVTGRVAEAAVVAVGGLVGAAVWAQAVEGTPGLLRPFGYFGYVIGVGVTLAGLGVVSGWESAGVMLGGFAVAAPWAQMLGRVRCLVQGCCHGRAAEGAPGIVVVNPHSRAARVPGLAGRAIHPTQVWSMGANVALGVLVGRLWAEGLAVTAVAGVYLIGASLARFVEESYRGEPQTPRAGGLAVYHWTSVGALAVGAVLTCVPGPAGPVMVWGWWSTIGTLAAGVIFALAMSVDFPDSSRRFARLTG